MKKTLLALTLLTATGLAQADGTFECKIRGVTVYQYNPCSTPVPVTQKAVFTPIKPEVKSERQVTRTEVQELQPYTYEGSKVDLNAERNRKLEQEAQQKREQEEANSVRYSTSLKKNIKKGDLYIGMSRDDLIWSWGETSRINKTITANTTREQHVYRELGSNVYVVNGIVTSLQTH